MTSPDFTEAEEPETLDVAPEDDHSDALPVPDGNENDDGTEALPEDVASSEDVETSSADATDASSDGANVN